MLVSASERASLLVARVAAETVLMSGCSYDSVDEAQAAAMKRASGRLPGLQL